MNWEERSDLLLKILASTDGEFVIGELMKSYVLDEDLGVIEERAAIDHPFRAYYEAGQRSVVLKLRQMAEMVKTTGGSGE